jgi:hypothetical protein
LYKEINLMLSKPSSFFKWWNDKIWIISHNRFINREANSVIQLIDEKKEVAETFYTFKDCAKYLQVSPQTIPNRIKNNSESKFNGKLYILKKAE